jgi:hypothetical protein
MASQFQPESKNRASGALRLARGGSLPLSALRDALSGRTSTTTRY